MCVLSFDYNNHVHRKCYIKEDTMKLEELAVFGAVGYFSFVTIIATLILLMLCCCYCLLLWLPYLLLSLFICSI